MTVNIHFKISYHHGEAQYGRLDLYDAGVSIHGLAKALTITTHALLNDGAVRKKEDRLDGAKIYINPSRRGSFEELVTLVISQEAAVAFGVSVVAAGFWDILKWTWGKALDIDFEPQSTYSKKLSERKEPFIGEIAEALEVPLEQVYRPIKKAPEMVISIQRPRVGEVVRLNNDTLQSVSLTTETDITEDIVVNVTRYNILSGYGRLYDDAEEKTFSFKITDDITIDQRELLTWSMHEAQTGNKGKLSIDAHSVLTANGKVKRYIVKEVRKKMMLTRP